MVSPGFFIDLLLPAALWPGVDSACTRNQYQEYFLRGKGGRCIRLTTLPPSCSNCLEIWEPQPSGTLRACPGLYRDCIAFTFWCRCVGRPNSVSKKPVVPPSRQSSSRTVKRWYLCTSLHGVISLKTEHYHRCCRNLRSGVFICVCKSWARWRRQSAGSGGSALTLRGINNFGKN